MLNPGWKPADRRAIQTRDVTDADVLISDGTTPMASLIGRASVAGVPLVIWPDAPNSEYGPASVPVILGANVGSALVDALLTHPASMPTPEETTRVAWTEPGRPHTDGVPIAFPEPVGAAWSEERSSGRFVAYRDDEWAGATSVVEGPGERRVVGVADHGAHLEALTLAAVGIVAAAGFFETGIQPPQPALPEILAEARNLELDVAVWRSTS
jgi:hypothetical protein